MELLQFLGTPQVDQAALCSAIEGVGEVFLVVEADDQRGSCTTTWRGSWASSAVVIQAGRRRDAPGVGQFAQVGEGVDPDRLVTGKEEQERAIDLRRTAVGLGQEKEQGAARAEGQGVGTEAAWSDQLRVPELPARIIPPLVEIAGALKEISSSHRPT